MNHKEFRFCNTTVDDRETVFWFFKQAMSLQGLNGYKVWEEIENSSIETDLVSNLQYKVMKGEDVVCIFSIQYSDPLIWRERDQQKAIYLHRIITHPSYKGKRILGAILRWANELALQVGIDYIRLDTWADNRKIIDYYLTFGFYFLENYKTPDSIQFPVQDRNLELALLEMKVDAI